MKISIDRYEAYTIFMGCVSIGLGLDSFGAFMGAGAILVSIVELKP